MQVTVVTPSANVEPEAGEQVTVAAGVPVEEGVAKVTTLLQVVISAGQAPITGDSFIVTLKVQEEFPHELFAVQVTTVVPVAKVDPEAGTHVTVAAGEPDAVGFVHVAI